MLLRFRNTAFDLDARCHYMGILNVTPDSFSDGGRFPSVDAAVEHALGLVEQGADIIDIGGESTRPGSRQVDAAEERRRVLPVIEAFRRRSDTPLSIDTRNADTADAALGAGADMINDISAMTHDARMAPTALRHGAAVALMHMQGRPETMQVGPAYRDVVEEVAAFLASRVRAARDAGIAQVLVDPGIGFGKRVEDNLAILRRLRRFRDLGCPVLVGSSRKAFIGAVTGLPVTERLPGSIASCVVAALHGAQLLRVHDVDAVRHAVRLAEAIGNEREE